MEGDDRAFGIMSGWTSMLALVLGERVDVERDGRGGRARVYDRVEEI